MNRPSRTDDDFEHPTWNQNPPFLAPDLTTCQDLNGIANAREQRNQGSGATNSFGFPNDEKSADPRSFEANTPRLPIAACAMSGRKLRPSCRMDGIRIEYGVVDIVQFYRSAHCCPRDSARW